MVFLILADYNLTKCVEETCSALESHPSGIVIFLVVCGVGTPDKHQHLRVFHFRLEQTPTCFISMFTQVNVLLEPSVFFGVIRKLLQSNNPTVRRKAMELLNSTLNQGTGNYGENQVRLVLH